MRSQNAVLRLQHRPEGRIQDSDLEVCKEPMPTIKDGQMLVKNIYLSLDPTHRIWMSDIPQYAPSVELGDVMRSLGVGKIVESKNEDYPVGTYVSAMVSYLLVLTNRLLLLFSNLTRQTCTFL
jgi:NADPH-dependent curcumin reductase CurA